MSFVGLNKISDEAKRDIHVIRYDFIGIKPLEEPVCTLEEEFKPPSERPSVQDMIRIGRKKPRFKQIFKQNTNLGFNPIGR